MVTTTHTTKGRHTPPRRPRSHAGCPAAADAVRRSHGTAGRGKPPKTTIVLVHGAWADASSFAPVTDRLLRDGYPVLAVPNPLRGVASDAAYLEAILKYRTSGPVVLVGHSYGGAVITNAALSDPDVKVLVYLNAFVPAAGESLLALLSRGGPVDPSIFDAVPYPGAVGGDVDLYFKTAVFPTAFANGLPDRVGARLAVSQRPIAQHALLEESGEPAWATLPSWYVLGTEDHVIPPALQEFMANRAGSKVTEVEAGHLSMLSEPRAVERVIRAAARTAR